MTVPFGGQEKRREQPPALVADFLISAAQKSQFPEPVWPEIVLLGRSNAGKSSLLNSWLGRRGLARVGATPGRTRLVNFFHVQWRKDLQPFMLADLPGYGYAAAPKAMVAAWRSLVSDYLECGRPLKAALLLMDLRRDPSEDEFGLLRWLSGLNIPSWVVVTKADKLAPGARGKRLALVSKMIQNQIDPESEQFSAKPLAYSSLTGLGRAELTAALVDSGYLTSGLDSDDDYDLV